MVRTQIQLTEKQAEQLRRIASNRHQSVAEVIRNSIDLFMLANSERADRFSRAKSVAGRFSSGLRDVSARHDSHLAEAFSAK